MSDQQLWQPISTLKPNTPVIGIMVWPGNADTGVICGVKYDTRPNAVIDFQRGRWMECSHWTLAPSSPVPEEHHND